MEKIINKINELFNALVENEKINELLEKYENNINEAIKSKKDRNFSIDSSHNSASNYIKKNLTKSLPNTLMKFLEWGINTFKTKGKKFIYIDNQEYNQDIISAGAQILHVALVGIIQFASLIIGASFGVAPITFLLGLALNYNLWNQTIKWAVDIEVSLIKNFNKLSNFIESLDKESTPKQTTQPGPQQGNTSNNWVKQAQTYFYSLAKRNSQQRQKRNP